MDVFRSATLAIAIILLIFMGMIMYYEFKVNSKNVVYPPYTRECPDYSYEYVIPTTGEKVCMFNDSFTNNYNKLNNTFDNIRDSGVNLCGYHNNLKSLSPLQCSMTDGSKYEDCKFQSGDINPPLSMYFLKDSNKKTNVHNIKNCHLTLDGIV